MVGKLDLDLELDLDLDLDLGTRARRGRGARYNTEDFPTLIPAAPAVKVPTLHYKKGWKPEYRAWKYVQEFILKGAWGGGANTPITVILDDINKQSDFPVPEQAVSSPPARANPLDDAKLTTQVIGVLDASIDRADRALEILDQANGQGALNYWTGMLRIDPSKDKRTFLLMLVAHKIGEYVAMGLKDAYLMRRPAQVYPWIMPLIDGPDTPSFPSSHSLQAHLISGVLKLALATPVLPPAVATTPPMVNPFLKSSAEILAANVAAVGKASTSAQGIAAIAGGAWVGPQTATCLPYPETARALDVLADRVATNREIAGVHYHMDSLAGFYAAQICLQKLQALGSSSAFQKLVKKASEELKDLP